MKCHTGNLHLICKTQVLSPVIKTSRSYLPLNYVPEQQQEVESISEGDTPPFGTQYSGGF